LVMTKAKKLFIIIFTVVPKKGLYYYFALGLAAGIAKSDKYSLVCTRCGEAYDGKEPLLNWDKKHEHKK